MAEAKIRITAVDDATRTINRVSAGLQNLVAPLGALSGFAGAAGLTAIISGLRDMALAVDDLNDAAAGLGVTAVQLAELRAGALETGVGAEQLDKALTSLNLKISQAAGGNRQAIDFFKRLGIAFQEAGKVRSTVDVLEDFSNKFRSWENNARRADVAAEALGQKLGPKLAAYLDQGSEALRRNVGLTAETVTQAARLATELDKLQNRWDQIKNTILGGVLPALNEYIDAAQRLVLTGRLPEVLWKGVAGALQDVKRELADEKLQRFLQEANDPKARQQQFLANYGLGKVQAPAAPDESAAREAERRLKEAADAANEYKKAGLKAYLDEEAQSARRAAQVVQEYNRVLDEGVAIREEWKRTGLDENRRREDQDAARERARVDNFNKGIEETQRQMEDLGLVFESAFSKLGSYEFGDIFKSLGKDIAQVVYQMLILEPIIKRIKAAFSAAGSGGGFSFETLLGSLFGGARASGGPVSAGTGYLVGEKGPEFFVPSVSGTIIPNGGGMGVTVVQNVSIDARSDIATIRQAMAASKAEAVREVQQQMARRGALARA